eukprot:TRINITY_DN59928_c0_g1_i1.p1 TRINITY_DN59928_c0_g1~~TRINITY_DN59928_c0_g1_i1.p1  ORF type:complete len:620 (+),score=235.37 TRINITY_DN59928_c0_g1_i1:88-1860(+)
MYDGGGGRRRGKEQTNQLREIRNREKKYNDGDESVKTSYFTPSLVEICAKAVADTFPEQIYVEELLRAREPAGDSEGEGLKDNSDLLKLVTYQLSTDLPLDVCVDRVSDESYWKARCEARWPPVEGQLAAFIKYKEDFADTLRQSGDSGPAPAGATPDAIVLPEDRPKPKPDWRRTYLERHLEEFIMRLDDSDLYDEAAEAYITSVDMYVNGTEAAYHDAAQAERQAERLEMLYNWSKLDPKLVAGQTPWQVLQKLCELAPDRILALNLDRLRAHIDWVGGDDGRGGVRQGICSWLTHLRDLRVTYGVLDAQMNFRFSMFGIRKEDLVGRNHERGSPDEKGLVRVLRDNILNITRLALPENRITDDMTKGLLLGLVRNKTVETLDLSHNKIECDGARALATLLMKQGKEGQQGNKITDLDLSDNLIRVPGGRALGKALMLNGCLRKLSLRLNRLTDDGGKAVVDGLKENGSVRVLNLTNNELGAESAQSVSDALKCNTTVRELHLTGNNFSEDAGKLLLDAVRAMHNTSLVVMDCRASGVAVQDIEAINEILKARVDKQKKLVEQVRDNHLREHVEREVKDWKQRFYSED